jgi:hypothetical protein
MNFNQLYENLIKPTNRKDTLETMIQSKGWKFLSSGAYGSVYGKPDKNYVLKVYRDAGYRTFLDFVDSEQGNPNVVMIRRHIFKSEQLYPRISPNVEVVALEKLKPIPYGSIWGKLISETWWAIMGDKTLKTADRPILIEKIRKGFRDSLSQRLALKYGEAEIRESKKIIKAFEYAIQNHKNLFDTIFRLRQYIIDNNIPEVRFDLHSGNFMVRPSTGQIVITDPLALNI